MANRFPLIANSSANQIQELAVGDNLDLTGSGISNVGNINASGISTLGNTVVGGGTTQLIVTGNARITGILTIGTSSITLDGSNNQVNVGTGVTLHHTNGVQVGGNTLHSTVLTVNQINASGVITATSFSGSGANLTGLAATANVTTSSLVVIGVSTVAAGTTAAPSITPTGDSNTGIFFPSADTIAFGEGGVEAARVDSSGRLLLGTSTSVNDNIGGTGYPNLVQILGGSTGAGLAVRNTADAGRINIGRLANVGNDSELGTISFGQESGPTVERARLSCFAETTGGAGNAGRGGNLRFYTSADGAASPTEAMRINNQRELLIGTTTRTANGGVLQVSNGITFPATQSACSDANTLDDYEEGTWTPTLGGNATYSVQTGTYTKIGRFIYASAMITVNTLGTGTNREIAGLPFNINLSNNDIGAVIGYVNACASNYIQISAGSYITSIVLACKTTASTDQGSAAVFQNGTAVRVTFTYFT